MKRYFINILIGLDQLLTAILGGWPDETLSSYAWRLERQNKLGGVIFRPTIDAVFSLWEGPNHCFRSFELERLRRQMPPELRDVSQVGLDQA